MLEGEALSGGIDGRDALAVPLSICCEGRVGGCGRRAPSGRGVQGFLKGATQDVVGNEL